jgi:voltage-gated potassium channel
MNSKNNSVNNIQQGNYIYMFIGLITLLLIIPALSVVFPVTSSILSQIAFITVMIIGVWSLNYDKQKFTIGIVLALTGIVLTSINFFLDLVLLKILSLICVFLFCLISIVIAIRHILFSGKITLNKIIGSVCIYLLIGVLWGLMYIFTSYFEPDAFDGLTINNNQTWDFIYYSFVTLTTLGYGDINPVIPVSRSLAYLEAICGQFYLAILVASLVGAHLTEREQK